MKQASALRQLGATEQKLLRQLLLAPQGATVELLCGALGVTHNAIRQHLTALIVAGFVERGSAQPTGGRPQTRYVLLAAGRELFPRNYGLIAASVLERLCETAGKPAVQALLADMGRELGASAAERINAVGDDETAHALADQLDALGYEAWPCNAMVKRRSRRKTAYSTHSRRRIPTSAASILLSWKRRPGGPCSISSAFYAPGKCVGSDWALDRNGNRQTGECPLDAPLDVIHRFYGIVLWLAR